MGHICYGDFGNCYRLAGKASSPVLIYTRSATRAQLTLCAPGDDLRLLQPDPTAHLMEGELPIMIARLERVDVDFSFPIVLPAPQSRSHERSRGRSNIQ